MKKNILMLLALSPLLLVAQTSTQEINTHPVAGRAILINIPEKYSLFGENVPLHVQDVKERFDRELLINTYLQGSNLYIVKLSSRWLPAISQKLKAANIPEDFKYLCIAESALQNLVSKAGASGFWQFMSGTAPSYGLEVNAYVDERYHPLKSTDAAIIYLKQAYAKFGNWTAAAASYNCGMGGYNSRAMQQGTFNYYDLFLPDETMKYIFRIMALKYILENPTETGFVIGDDHKYDPIQTRDTVVTYPIPSLISFAKSNGTNYKMLRWLNPWIRSTSLPNRSGKAYTILLPVGTNGSNQSQGS
jgi:membrane-bound lytic murein transglycosylase D